MKKANVNNNFIIPTEYCGQGVAVSSNVSIAADGSAYINGKIDDGNGNNIGTFELSDAREKLYLNLRETKGLKRRTLVNIIGKIKETLECALDNQLEAESDDAPAEASPAEEETSAEE